MLNKHQFDLLSTAMISSQKTQMNTLAKSNTSAESAIEAQKKLLNLGYLNEAGDATEAGKTLSPHTGQTTPSSLLPDQLRAWHRFHSKSPKPCSRFAAKC